VRAWQQRCEQMAEEARSLAGRMRLESHKVPQGDHHDKTTLKLAAERVENAAVVLANLAKEQR
jgi:hypothetical protein